MILEVVLWDDVRTYKGLSEGLIRVDDAFSDGGLYEARHVVHLELLHYIVPVALDRGERDEELPGYFPARRAVGDVLQYLLLPLGEGVEGVLGLVLLDDVDEVVKELLGHGRARVLGPGGDPFDGLHEFGRVRVLEHVAERACPEGLYRPGDVGVHRQYDDLCVRELVGDAPGGGYAVQVGHGDVKDGYVGLERRYALQRGDAVVSLAHYLELFGAKYGLYPAPQDRVVVGYEDPCFFHVCGKKTVSDIIMRARGESKDLLGLSLIDDLSQGLDALGPRYYGLDLVLVKGLVLYERD